MGKSNNYRDNGDRSRERGSDKDVTTINFHNVGAGV